MAVFNLATATHSYEMIMFPEPYEKNGARLEDGKLALIHGQIGRRNGEMSLTAHEIDLEQSIPALCNGSTSSFIRTRPTPPISSKPFAA